MTEMQRKPKPNKIDINNVYAVKSLLSFLRNNSVTNSTITQIARIAGNIERLI